MFPISENEFLIEVIEGLRKRRRSIARKVNKIACNKAIEINGDDRREKLEIFINIKDADEKIILSINVWEDRWVWINYRVTKAKALSWQWIYDGRCFRQNAGINIIHALELTLGKTYSTAKDGAVDLTKLWEKLLARGPKQAGIAT